jgi:hypothetical protein
MKQKLIVDLACCSIEPCLIILCKSGIFYTNQTDGICCLHPEVEGVLVPLSYRFNKKTQEKPDNSLEVDFYSDDKISTRKWIKKFNIPIKQIGICSEAWERVIIMPHKDKYSPLYNLIGFEAILTYNNSD